MVMRKGQVIAVSIPHLCSMYGIFTYIWLDFFLVYEGKYSSPVEHRGTTGIQWI